MLAQKKAKPSTSKGLAVIKNFVSKIKPPLPLA